MYKLIQTRKIQIIIIVVLTVLAYSNIFKNQFVWDDQFFIQEWKEIRDWKNFPLMLKGAQPPRYKGAFRPGLSVNHLVFYQIFGTNPIGWHLQSLIVHLICTILVYLIASLVISNVVRNMQINLEIPLPRQARDRNDRKGIGEKQSHKIATPAKPDQNDRE